MPLQTNLLSLKITQPDDATPIQGTWRIWLETHNGIAMDPFGPQGIAGSYLLTTDADGLAEIELPDTTDGAFDPLNAPYRASFASIDRRVRLKSEPFLMDGPKTFPDIMTATALPVTPSLAAQTEAARDDARAAAAEVLAALATVGDLMPRAEVEALIAAEAAARDAAIQAILDQLGSNPITPLSENATDPGTYTILAPAVFTEDPADPGTYLNTSNRLTEDPADAGTYLIGA